MYVSEEPPTSQRRNSTKSSWAYRHPGSSSSGWCDGEMLTWAELTCEGTGNFGVEERGAHHAMNKNFQKDRKDNEYIPFSFASSAPAAGMAVGGGRAGELSSNSFLDVTFQMSSSSQLIRLRCFTSSTGGGGGDSKGSGDEGFFVGVFSSSISMSSTISGSTAAAGASITS
nr:hypothetical protein Iba_chr07aCG8350 [Ipomoea batatas]